MASKKDQADQKFIYMYVNIPWSSLDENGTKSTYSVEILLKAMKLGLIDHRL